MATKSIEERAHNYAITNESNIQDWDGNYEIMVMSYEVGAQDQDRISRQEERERCIKVACDWICRSFCNCGDPNGCSVTCRSMTEEKIRKAIEEGGNQ